MAVGFALLVAGSGRLLANDAFADATVIDSSQTQFFSFVSETGTSEPGEPPHAGSPAQESRWFRWTAPASQPCTFRDIFNEGTVRLAVYTGANLATLIPVAQGNGGVAFPAVAGTTYHLVVDSPGSDVVNLTVYQPGGADERADAQVISGALPLRVEGNNVLATVAPDDEDWLPLYPPVATVWWSWTPTNSGAVRMDARRSVIDARLTLYEKSPGETFVRVSAGVDIAVLQVTAGTEYLLCVDGLEGTGRIDFLLQEIPSGVPPNDLIANARDLGTATVTCDGEWIHHATSEVGAPNEDLGLPEFGIPGDRTLWWKWTCPASGTYRISQHGSDRASSIIVYAGSPQSGNFAASSNFPEGTLLNATVGKLYWIQFKTFPPHAARVEINLHPATHEPGYFKHLLDRGYFDLIGPDRHPEADPDGDGFSNEIEVACGSDPHLAQPDDARLPRLLPHNGGWKLEWQRDETYLTGGPGLPILIRGTASANLAGPWTYPGETTGNTSNVRSIMLPGPARGFARVELDNPNWRINP